MKTGWESSGNLLAPTLAMTQVIGETMAANGQAILICTDDLPVEALATLVDQFKERTICVGKAEDTIAPLAAGLANSGRLVLVVAANQVPIKVGKGLRVIIFSLRRVLVEGEQNQSCPQTDVALAPADVHQTAAAARWAVQQTKSVLIEVPVARLPVIWPANTEFDPTEQPTSGTGPLLIIAAGLTLPYVYLAQERAKAELISTKLLAITTTQPSQADRERLRRLVAASDSVLVCWPSVDDNAGSFTWLADYLSILAPKRLKSMNLSPTTTVDESYVLAMTERYVATIKLLSKRA